MTDNPAVEIMAKAVWKEENFPYDYDNCPDGIPAFQKRMIKNRARLYLTALTAAGYKLAGPEGPNWKDDPAADERWQAGFDFATEQMCKVLGIAVKDVCWDAATETLDGDAQSIICNIMHVKYGEEWCAGARLAGPDEVVVPLADLEMLRTAIQCNDPSKELSLRINDIIEEFGKAYQNALQAAQPAEGGDKP